MLSQYDNKCPQQKRTFKTKKKLISFVCARVDKDCSIVQSLDVIAKEGKYTGVVIVFNITANCSS